jgi:TonB dependent receptor
VNGQDPRNNNFMLDGANNNDDVSGQRAGTQVRTPLEAVAEFQVITNQFDAEFGRTTGAIINALTRQGSNRFSGSGFLFAQDASLTSRDYFARKLNLQKPPTSQMQGGGTFGGPVVRDKAHVFFSVERVKIDKGVTVNLPERPEFNATTTEKTRVWNTVARFDHQLTPNHTYAVRWLRETSPQLNQLIGNVTLAASRDETDIDQMVVGTVNSVLGNTRVNSLRLSWTQEDVAFLNPCANSGRSQAACLPSLAYQTFTDQQHSVRGGRVSDSYGLENTLSWFVPHMRGDHDIKLGIQAQYSRSRAVNQGNLNGTFSFGNSDAAFDAANPRTYPDRFSIRVPGTAASVNKATYFSPFVQDKWKLNDRLTLSLGLRYDLEIIPIREVDNPRFAGETDYPVDKNNLQPRVGFSYATADQRSVIRGGAGRFVDKTHFELIADIHTNTVFATSFIRQFPQNNFDPGPRQGRLPTDPFLVNGPTITDAMRAQLAALFPPGSLLRNPGASWDNPDRVVPYADQASIGYERQLGANLSASADYVHAFGRDLLIARQLNPMLQATTAVTAPNVRQGSAALTASTAALQAQFPGFVPFSGAVTVPENVGRTDYDALMLQIEKRYSRNYSARVAYTLAYSRGNTSGGATTPNGGVPISGFQVLDDLGLDRNEGPTSFDQRHNFVLSGTARVPHTGGLSVAVVTRALSGSPFTLVNSNVDPDRNGVIAEPLPAGNYSATGEDAYTVDNENRRNGAYGPGFFKIDVRLGYQIGMFGRRLDLFGEVFNLTDRVNFTNPNGNEAAADFLRLTGLSTNTTPRTFQVGARFQF